MANRRTEKFLMTMNFRDRTERELSRQSRPNDEGDEPKRGKRETRKTILRARNKPPTTEYQCDSLRMQARTTQTVQNKVKTIRTPSELDPTRNKNFRGKYDQTTERANQSVQSSASSIKNQC